MRDASWRVLTFLIAAAAVTATGGVSAFGVCSDQEKSAGRIISGRVVDGSTGEALVAARVEIARVDRPLTPVVVSGDSRGQFETATLPPGRYTVFATASGYIRGALGQQAGFLQPRVIRVDDGPEPLKVEVALFKGAALEGTIWGTAAKPLPNVDVQIFRRVFVAGRHRFMRVPGPSGVPTDSRGFFRLTGLPSGSYYVGAFVQQPQTEGVTSNYHPTFYPGGTIGSAVSLDIASGIDTRVEIEVNPGPVSRISGVAVNEVDELLAGQPVSFLLFPLVEGEVVVVSGPRSSTKDGRFDFRNVPVGDYVVQALAPGAFGSAVVRLEEEGVAELQVRVRPAHSVRGQVILPQTALLPQADVRIALVPTEFTSNPVVGSGMGQTVPRQDWSFEAKGVFGQGVLRVDLPAPWVVDKLLVAGREVADVRAVGPTENVEIHISPDGASLRGALKAPDEDRVDYQVLFFPVDAKRRVFNNTAGLRLVRSDQDGRFELTGIPPGKYFVVALSRVDENAWQDPEFLGKLVGVATEVNLLKNESRQLTLSLSGPR